MPPPRLPPTLFDVSCAEAAALCLAGLRNCDQLWTPPKPATSPRPSPPVSPVKPNCLILRPPRPGDRQCNDDHDATSRRIRSEGAIREWLRGVPVEVLDNLVRRLLEDVERLVSTDIERRLILALINIERTKPPDFFFGVYSFLSVMRDTRVSQLPFTARLWSGIAEYGQLYSSGLIQNRLKDSIPHLGHLVQANLSHVATNDICHLISRHLHQLEDLTLDYSMVTETGLNYISGNSSTSNAKNSRLRRLSLQGCGLPESVIWSALMSLGELSVLRYDQSVSLAEMLNAWCQSASEETLETTRLKISHYTHPFPYRIALFDDVLSKVIRICPFITVLNVVTEDPMLESFSAMVNVKRAQIELEDCFGLGLHSYLAKMGGKLEELVISCSSDADSTFLPEGGQPHQLLNAGLKLAALFCSRELRVLHVAGCGLVSNFLLDKLAVVAKCELSALARLTSLVYLSYEDEPAVQSCEGRVLADTLQGCVNLECLSLEGNFSNFLDDRYLQSGLLARNALSRLRIFDVSGTRLNRLTASSARRLAALPSLRELRLGSWGAIEERAFKELVEFANGKGWDILITRNKRPMQQQQADGLA